MQFVLQVMYLDMFEHKLTTIITRTFFSLDNIFTNMEVLVRRFTMQAVGNAYVSVDSFFLLRYVIYYQTKTCLRPPE